MKKTKKDQLSGDQTLAMGLLSLSGAFALIFLLSVCIVGQNIRQGHGLGGPNSYAGWPAVLLALYVWFKSPRPVHRYRYVILVILSLLLAGFIIWLYGMTGAGHSLVSSPLGL